MEIQEEDNPDARKVIFVGLDHAGKTSIILSLLREISKFAIIKPTRNIERRTFEFLGMKISEWELGGHERYRKLYLEEAQLIFRGTDILIYVLDIQDRDRIVESCVYLKDIIDKLIEMKLNPPIYVFIHKDDPDFTKSVQTKVNDTISYLKNKIKDFQKCIKLSFYETSVFEPYSIINAMSEILLNLYPKSKVIETAIQEFAYKNQVDGIALIDDNSLIIGTYYKTEVIKEILNSLSPHFLRLNDVFDELDNSGDHFENQMIVEKLEKNFLFKQFKLMEDNIRFYILLCTDKPFFNKFEFNPLFNLLKKTISYDI
ncbi:MAG: ADP-ribosylation factor-like protein [Candidatus Hermodarchaeota archaeon]